MDSSDAIAVVNERIKEFETEEIARKVLGYIYLQDYSVQELIPLALGPDIAIQNLILTAKAALQLPSAAVDFSPISSLVNPMSNADHLLQYALFSSASPRHQPLSPWVAEARLWEYQETEQQAVPEFMGLKDQFEPLDSVGALSPWVAEARLWEYQEAEQQAVPEFMGLKDQFEPLDSVGALSPRVAGARLWEYQETEQQAVPEFMGLKDQFEPLDSVGALSPWVAEARLWEYQETEQQAVPEFMGLKDQFEPLDSVGALSPRLAGARLWEYQEAEQQAVPEFMGLKDQFEPLDSVVGVNNVSLLHNPNSKGAKTCPFFIQGFCKHGNNCLYFHGQYLPKNYSHNFGPKTNEFGYEDQVFLPGSLKRLEMEITELLKSRGGGPIPISFLPMLYFERYGRTICAEDYPTESQRFGKPSTKLTKLLSRLNNTIRVLHKPEGQHEIVLAEHVPKGVGAERNYPAPIAGGSCKIFFTFPVESTFTIRDISRYFSAFGPVEDVKIPRYQKGTYGVVTFSSSDTVEIILAKGNPHYIRGMRVFVKPAEVNYHSERKDHDQHDPSLYSSHMYTNSEHQERLIEKWLIEVLAKTVEIETKSLFNRNLCQSPDANQAYFDHLIYESRVSQDGRHEEINHIDPDSSHEFGLPYSWISHS